MVVAVMLGAGRLGVISFQRVYNLVAHRARVDADAWGGININRLISVGVEQRLTRLGVDKWGLGLDFPEQKKDGKK